MTTPDEVTIVLPSEGLIGIAYQAVWESSVVPAAQAAIFLGSNQLQASKGGSGPGVQFAEIASGAGRASISTCGAGLVSTIGAGYSADVTTGQVVGAGPTGASAGACYVFAAAGTYKITVQFKSSSGEVKIKNRKLWAWLAT
jgi:hypothetical protein